VRGLGTCLNHAWMLLDQLALRAGFWRFHRLSDGDDQHRCEFCSEEADYLAEEVPR
jgi:hypothetical protein